MSGWVLLLLLRALWLRWMYMPPSNLFIVGVDVSSSLIQLRGRASFPFLFPFPCWCRCRCLILIISSFCTSSSAGFGLLVSLFFFHMMFFSVSVLASVIVMWCCINYFSSPPPWLHLPPFRWGVWCQVFLVLLLQCGRGSIFICELLRCCVIGCILLDS